MIHALTSPPFSADGFRVRAGREQGPHDGSTYGDHRLNPELHDLLVRQKLHDAAVLFPVVDRGDEATVILTKRAEKLRNHSGQVAFPGGRIDATDASPEAAALRETAEEIGLDQRFIDIVGRMPDYVTGSGYRITPVLGIVRPGFALTINEEEVDNVFEVPLRFLMDPANHLRDSRIWLERERFFYRMPYETWNIWGVTAGIIHALYERLYE
jgi:8-oxo-dGTP pyrophosphatase MutT (NUDIX family)